MTIIPFDDEPLDADELTDYDRRHFVTYLRMLDAQTEGADWREVALILFGIDAEQEPRRAQVVHANHLARATWMTEHGYRHLLSS